jgi:telomere length regulation protein
MWNCRGISKHEEAYVRRAALYAASQVIQALHPSQVASAVTGGDETIAKGLDWIREWALGIAENDVDSETSTVRPPSPHIQYRFYFFCKSLSV